MDPKMPRGKPDSKIPSLWRKSVRTTLKPRETIVLRLVSASFILHRRFRGSMSDFVGFLWGSKIMDQRVTVSSFIEAAVSSSTSKSLPLAPSDHTEYTKKWGRIGAMSSSTQSPLHLTLPTVTVGHGVMVLLTGPLIHLPIYLSIYLSI